MLDVNADGKIDQVRATFSETLAHPAGTAPWTLIGVPSNASLSSVSTSQAVATLALTSGPGAADTDVGSFTIALSANANGIRDAAGNQAGFTATAPTDCAAPVLMTVAANNRGGNGNGGEGLMQHNDTFVITFSEALEPESVPTTVTVTQSRSADISTLTIRGLIRSALIANSYVTSGSGSSPDTTVTLTNKTVTATLGDLTKTTKDALAQGTGAAQIVPASTLTDRDGNAAAATARSTGSPLF